MVMLLLAFGKPFALEQAWHWIEVVLLLKLYVFQIGKSGIDLGPIPLLRDNFLGKVKLQKVRLMLVLAQDLSLDQVLALALDRVLSDARYTVTFGQKAL
jgi:hypothetical protein